MENPRPEKVAVVDEVREKFVSSNAALFTEYRGLTVRDLAELRTAMRDAGGEYRVYKNTLVRRAVAELELELGDELVGPTAIVPVGQRLDGTPGDPAMVAKAPARPRSVPTWSPRVVCWTPRCSTRTVRRHLPPLRPARNCSPASRVVWRRRCATWPLSCRRCPRSSPTAYRR